MHKFIILFCTFQLAISASENRTIETYFAHFELLAKSENWNEILAQGKAALETARKEHRLEDEAKICAQLTSTAFYKGDYPEALFYANRCHELAESFTDPSLFIRALYLESAVYRALAAKNGDYSYRQAVATAEEAASLYASKGVTNQNLQGKVYFNLGAAHADDPKGNLDKAGDCYSIALACFRESDAVDDLIRTSIRLGKVYLLQKKPTLCQQLLDEIRPQITSERLAMHADYLEAQLKFAIHDVEGAALVANRGLARAKALGAKEDELRLSSLLEVLQI